MTTYKDTIWAISNKKSPINGFTLLTFLKLVGHNDQKSNRYEEEVEDIAYLTEVAYGRTAHISDHSLIGVLSTDWRRIAQDDKSTDQEHKRNLCKTEIYHIISWTELK